MVEIVDGRIKKILESEKVEGGAHKLKFTKNASPRPPSRKYKFRANVKRQNSNIITRSLESSMVYAFRIQKNTVISGCKTCTRGSGWVSGTLCSMPWC